MSYADETVMNIIDDIKYGYNYTFDNSFNKYKKFKDMYSFLSLKREKESIDNMINSFNREINEFYENNYNESLVKKFQLMSMEKSIKQAYDYYNSNPSLIFRT
jgi:hypothetical protein